MRKATPEHGLSEPLRSLIHQWAALPEANAEARRLLREALREREERDHEYAEAVGAAEADS